MVTIYEDIEIEDEIIVPVPLKKCVIPSCKNVGRGQHTFCNKHKKIYRYELFNPPNCISTNWIQFL